MNAILQMRNIHKSFGATRALQGVDLDILRGQVNAVVGSNGAGKSTLMKTLAGIYRPDEGKIFLDGQDITGLTPLKLQELGIQVVHQVLNIVGSMSVLENILLANPPLRHGVLQWKSGADTVRAILERIDFPLDLRAPAGALSVSQQQFVILARALIHQPKVLVLDEPTARLGMEETQKLFSLIRTLKAQGTTVIYISHRLDEIYTICDRISIFRDGMHVLSRETDALGEAELVQAMLGKRMETFFPKVQASIGEEILRVENLRDPKTLNGVGFTVRSGEIVSLVGAVGAGKTEILECLFGLRKADAGQIVFRGKPLGRSHGAQRAIGMGMALIPEDRNLQGLIGNMSIADNLVLKQTDEPQFSSLHGLHMKKKTISASAREMIGKYDIRCQSSDQEVRNLSGGNQQKVILARELESDPDVLIAVHPTRGLDIGATRFVHDQMIAARDRGVGILLISADFDEILEMSDRILVIFEGQIMGEYSGKNPPIEEISLAMTGK